MSSIRFLFVLALLLALACLPVECQDRAAPVSRPEILELLRAG
ncbi:MAG: hypothetical protein RIR52_1649, partial [Acidobacteriota bacterium]